MNRQEICPEFIKITGRSIRSLISSEDNDGFFDSMFQYLGDFGYFPQDVDQQILDKIYSLNGKKEDASSVLEDYLFLMNQQDKSLIDQLHLAIFETPTPLNSIDYYQDDSDDPITEQLPPVLTLAMLGRIQEKSISQIAEVFNMNIEVAEVLLKLFHFKKEELFDQYPLDHAKYLAQIGLTDQQIEFPIHFCKPKRHIPNLECPICFNDESSGDDFYALPCGHYFCKPCITEYIKAKIDEGKSEIICPNGDCNCNIVLRDVIKFCGPEIATNYFNYILENEVTTEGHFHHCMRDDPCPNLLTDASVGYCDTATCTCGFRMCWKCKQKAHAPLQCDLIDRWNNLAKEENIDLKWIKEHTKPCPNCKERIDRWTGCNYVKCIKCGHEFCFNCGAHFPNHVHAPVPCVNGQLSNNVQLDGNPNVDLNRLNIYLTGYFNHKNLQENELKERQNRYLALLEIFERYDVPSERLDSVQSLSLANDIFMAIDAARSILIWSFPYAFFMDPGSQKIKDFVKLQDALKDSIEKLSILAENKQYESPQVFRQLLSNLKKSTNELLVFAQTNRK